MQWHWQRSLHWSTSNTLISTRVASVHDRIWIQDEVTSKDKWISAKVLQPSRDLEIDFNGTSF